MAYGWNGGIHFLEKIYFKERSSFLVLNFDSPNPCYYCMPLARMKKKLSPGLTHMSVKTPHPHPQSLSLKKTEAPTNNRAHPSRLTLLFCGIFRAGSLTSLFAGWTVNWGDPRYQAGIYPTPLSSRAVLFLSMLTIHLQLPSAEKCGEVRQCGEAFSATSLTL
jgi:hypothetical protein